MSDNNQSIDEMLECAVREKAAMEHMLELDLEERMKHRRRLRYFGYGAAACVAVFAFTGISLSSGVRKAGYAFDPTFGQMGGSEISALMQEKRIDEAMYQIDLAITEVEAQMANPSSSDPDYLSQLNIDRQELDFLDAVCLMRKGKYFKARKALKAIVEAGGAFSGEANELLEQM